MTQAELNAIWNQLLAGNEVEGWGGHRSGTFDVMTNLPSRRVWYRPNDATPWEEMEGLRTA